MKPSACIINAGQPSLSLEFQHIAVRYGRRIKIEFDNRKCQTRFKGGLGDDFHYLIKGQNPSYVL